MDDPSTLNYEASVNEAYRFNLSLDTYLYGGVKANQEGELEPEPRELWRPSNGVYMPIYGPAEEFVIICARIEDLNPYVYETDPFNSWLEQEEREAAILKRRLFDDELRLQLDDPFLGGELTGDFYDGLEDLFYGHATESGNDLLYEFEFTQMNNAAEEYFLQHGLYWGEFNWYKLEKIYQATMIIHDYENFGFSFKEFNMAFEAVRLLSDDLICPTLN